eukprot:TRINITY_DN4275_c0_g2_i1.p1 TRINITY_DN4275_c0_g2~~TRINITY_DN4275_c0_g2_i1.p1  ORF type:complete len:215 (-),score=33.45 TRINITY_DN4275_c0_g2_i1:15-659(-)
MGYFLIYESMLQSVLFARDRWLKPNGLLFPSIARLYMTPFNWDEFYEDHFDYWSNVYGFDFSPMVALAKKAAFTQPTVESLNPENQIAEPALVKIIDCRTIQAQELENWQCDLTFQSMLMAPAHGILAFFEVEFPAAPDQPPVILSTSVRDPPTHWAQTLFFFDEPVELGQDDMMYGSASVSINPQNHRFIDVHLQWSKEKNSREMCCKEFTIQ